MSEYKIFAWHPLIRPPLPNELPSNLQEAPLKALACRNSFVSVAALVTVEKPVNSARLVVSDLTHPGGVIPSSAVRIRQVGTVNSPEAGLVCDPLFDVDEFSLEKSASFYITINVPENITSGTYNGKISLFVNEDEVASNEIELEVSVVSLPDPQDWSFFLNIWMNPAPIARVHNVELWSDEHFDRLRSYVEDLALHGQKTVVVPICYQPWGTQTFDPFPNSIKWTKRNGKYEFDFSIFDRYVELHESCGIGRAIHCYSIVQGPGETDSSVIAYTDSETGREELLTTQVGDNNYIEAWSQFFDAFRRHLTQKGWMKKTYISFDEKPPEVMKKLIDFIDRYASDFLISLAGNTTSDLYGRIDDLCVMAPFDESGIAEKVPPQRSAMGVAQLLDPDNTCVTSAKCPDKPITTYYVCCGPEFPNTFVFSPLVESRMLGFFAAQGGYDGFLRWAYNDWTDEPFEKPNFSPPHVVFPTGDTFFVYPGEDGPVSSLRWEQLRESIQDYELARIASSNIQTPDEMVDYEQAISLACRNPNGRTKAVSDIELARRLLMPIAEHQAD